MNENNTLETFEYKLHLVFKVLEQDFSLPENTFDIDISKAKKQDSSTLRFVVINEAPYPKGLNMPTRKTVAFKYSIGSQIKLFVQRQQFPFLSLDLDDSVEVKDLQSDVAFLHIYYPLDSESVFHHIVKILAYCIHHYSPANSFGCCGKYRTCSDSGVCVHENNLYAKGCLYRKNLEAGNIFYAEAPKPEISIEISMGSKSNSSKNKRTQKGSSLTEFVSDFVVLDIETTGFDPKRDRIIEVAAIKVQNNQIVDTFSELINPEIEISSFISTLTGITNEDLATARYTESVLRSFSDFIGHNILVGHNVHFDINFLYDNFEKYFSLPLENDFIDTLRLSKKLIPNLASYKLSTLTDFFGIETDTMHRALADCYATLAIYFKLKDQNFSEHSKLLDSLNFDESNPFFGKRIVVKGKPQLYDFFSYETNFRKMPCENERYFL